MSGHHAAPQNEGPHRPSPTPVRHSLRGSSAPLVLIAPAMAIGSHFYKPLVAEFARNGWEAHTIRRRGFERGEPRADRRHDWSYQDEIDDIDHAITRARRQNPERPILLLGHSLGGQLVAGHQLNHPAVEALVTVAAALPHHRTYRFCGLHVLLMGAVAVPLLTTLFGYVPAPAFGGPGARTLMRQWAHTVITGNPPYKADRRITTPALVVSFASDAMAPPRSVDTFAEKLFDTRAVTRWQYEHDDVLPGASNDHIRWVRGSSHVVERIVAWWTEP
ncbi:alpha/beta fold hydrolase [Rhodococcus erythropolis]|uniref:alpha/beta fold hydrolase n=1 Tax=Rhodococcus erythropolis TaxID=1833 RepID=UPI003A4D81AC|nr:alpha/beta fold hydrolase [Rhodococcus sp. (in: high G+C Gram-positive bacteria)]